MIFIDSDVFIGLRVELDVHHKEVESLLECLGDEILITSWEVIDEVSTKLSYQTSKETAIQFLEYLNQSQIRVEFLDKQTSEVAKRIFVSLKSKNISMTDCANMAIARKLKITTFFSFDEHYPKNGFKLLTTHT